VPTFSFARLKNSDPRLGVEMQSTGEVACIGNNQYEAFLKAMVAAGFKIPTKNVLITIGPINQKIEFATSGAAKMLQDMGFQLFATKGTHEFLKNHGAFDACTLVYKPLVRREPNALTLLTAGKIDLVINVPDSMDSMSVTDGFRMRRGAIDSATSLVTDMKIAILLVQSLHRKHMRESRGKAFWSYSSWQEHMEVSDEKTAR
jgi:predicted RNA binding protein YcfA (HicA-like mRNA interferase family)